MNDHHEQARTLGSHHYLGVDRLVQPTSVHVESADIFLGCDFISPTDDDGFSAGVFCLSHTFSCAKTVSSAVLSITALGTFSVSINSQIATEDILAPGWTDYRHRLLYSQYDVTRYLKPGNNKIDVLLGNGWYRGQLGRPARRDLYGERLAVLVSLELVFNDGSTFTVCSNECWLANSTVIAANDLYDGCIIDYSRPRRISGVDVIPFDKNKLEKQYFPAIGVTEVIKSRDVTCEHKGKIVVDFGQNLVGWVRITLKKSTAGQTVVVRHAEALENGIPCYRPLRDAKACDIYHLCESDNLTLEPIFTFHGFRYVAIEGVEPEDLLHIEAVVVGSRLRRTGWFSCSEPLLDKLHQNVVWSMRGNFLSVPTDCPQRDERLGWTADIQVFAPTASFLFDCNHLLESWLKDLAAGQLPDGSVPVVIPDIYRRSSVATAGWGDAATIVPWVLYQYYGNETVLQNQYLSMTRWVKRIHTATGETLIWQGRHQYGDWLDPSAPVDDPSSAMTDRDLVATAYFYRSAFIVGETANILKNTEDTEYYRKLSTRIRERFQQTFVTPVGRLTSETQAAYAIAICFGLLDEQQLIHAGHRLADLVRSSGFTIGTGFMGTPAILDALSTTGHQHVAMRLLCQKSCPSWLFPVTMGATTMWERWDSMLPDGSINQGEMTSFNHYAFGSVADWMHRQLAGLKLEAPGWQQFSITPPMWSGLEHAHSAFISPLGLIETRWRRKNGSVDIEVVVPEGANAELRLPNQILTLSSGRQHFSLPILSQSDSADSSARKTLTVREAIDCEVLWGKVESAINVFRPEWTSRKIALAALPYFDYPLADMARCVGLSIPTCEEDALREMLTEMKRPD